MTQAAILSSVSDRARPHIALSSSIKGAGWGAPEGAKNHVRNARERGVTRCLYTQSGNELTLRKLYTWHGLCHPPVKSRTVGPQDNLSSKVHH